MSRRTPAGRRRQPARTGPQVGLFGLLGSGNIGNDASMEAVLSYLKAAHPGASIDAMCMGPDRLRQIYGLPAIPMLWYQRFEGRAPRSAAPLLKALGKPVDALRTLVWVRKHDAVIVPGMGVLEASLPLRPWGVPYAMFLLCASGRLTGTKVALVSVGANRISQRATRWFFDTAARLAFYRSYRDTAAREAMAQRGLSVKDDRVYPDLVFGRPMPPCPPGDPQAVGIGIMTYEGTNDHRKQASEIYAAYTETITRFIRWLLDQGRTVHLFVGDQTDQRALQDILADLRSREPAPEAGRVIAEPITSFAELAQAMEPISSVVATRYHNVMCALKLAKPVISLGYSGKNVSMMADMGLTEFCQYAHELDFDQLIRQFKEMESRSAELRHQITERCAVKAADLDQQFAILSALLFPGYERERTDNAPVQPPTAVPG